jgi:hypothetical protein
MPPTGGEAQGDNVSSWSSARTRVVLDHRGVSISGPRTVGRRSQVIVLFPLHAENNIVV